MNEMSLQVLAFLKIIALSGYAFLYGLGGMDGKWKRRIAGSAYLGGMIIMFSLLEHNFHWLYLLFPVLLYGATSLGYGANSTKQKIIKRSLYGLACGVASIPLAIPDAMFALLGLHIFLCVATSVSLGVFNITKNARSEETVIAVVIGLLPLFMV